MHTLCRFSIGFIFITKIVIGVVGVRCGPKKPIANVNTSLNDVRCVDWRRVDWMRQQHEDMSYMRLSKNNEI